MTDRFRLAIRLVRLAAVGTRRGRWAVGALSALLTVPVAAAGGVFDPPPLPPGCIGAPLATRVLRSRFRDANGDGKLDRWNTEGDFNLLPPAPDPTGYGVHVLFNGDTSTPLFEDTPDSTSAGFVLKPGVPGNSVWRYRTLSDPRTPIGFYQGVLHQLRADSTLGSPKIRFLLRGKSADFVDDPPASNVLRQTIEIESSCATVVLCCARSSSSTLKLNCRSVVEDVNGQIECPQP